MSSVPFRTVAFALASLAAMAASADPVLFTGQFTSTKPIVKLFVLASSPDLAKPYQNPWSVVASLGTVAEGLPATITSVPIYNSDGRFAFIASYDYKETAYYPGGAPYLIDHHGVEIGVSTATELFALNNGSSKSFDQTFPNLHISEDYVESYINGKVDDQGHVVYTPGAFLPYVVNSNEPHGGPVPNGFVFAQSDLNLLSFSNAEISGILHVTVTPAPVPEPASVAVLGLGAAMLRRRKRA